MSAVVEENMKGYNRKSIYLWAFKKTSERNDNCLSFEE